MRYLVLLFLVSRNFLSTLAANVGDGKLEAPHELPKRRLSAASRHSGIQTRDDRFTLSNSVEFIYADEEYNELKMSAMAATVRLESKNSILVLEDIEHLLYNIECTFGSLEISTSEVMDEHMRDQLRGLTNGHIITSHVTCNDAAGRQAYKVLSTSQSTASTVTLDILPVSWKDSDSFTSLSISLAREPTSTYTVRNKPHTSNAPNLNKRQGTAYDSSNFSFNIAPTISSFPSLPSDPPSSDSYSFNLANFGPFINTQYDLNMPGSSLSAPIAVGCTNCSFWGTVGIEFANFDYDLDVDNPLVSGTASLTAQGVGGHLALKTVLSDTWYFTFPLGRSLSYALEITSFAEVRFGLGEFIAGGYDMQGHVAMEYGFDMSVPSPASMTLNVGDPDSSNEAGFGSTRFTALPFDSQAQIQELDLWLALRTAVSVEIDIDGAGTIAETGIYIDVPRLNAHVTPVSDVDINCNPITSSTDNGDDDQNILTDPIKVEVYGSYDYGAYAKVKTFDPLTAFQHSDRIPVQKMCLNFNQETQSYSTAKEAVEGKGTTLSPPGASILALVIACALVILL